MKSSPSSGNGIYNNPWPPASSLEALRRVLNFTIVNETTHKEEHLKNSTFLNFTNLNLQNTENVFCECLNQLNHLCHA